MSLKRIIDLSGKSTNYLKSIGGYHHKSYESLGLREYSQKYSTLLSYGSVSNLLKEKDGSSLLSSVRIQQIIQEGAEEISLVQKEKIAKYSNWQEPKIDYDLDLYDSESEEIHIFEDAIGVRKQKELRDKSLKTNREWHYTDVIMLEQQDGSFKHIVSGFGLDLSSVFLSELQSSYGRKRKALPVVVFSDGASSIRERMESVLGKNVKRILDWYHLNKKIWNFMSMIAINSSEKEEKSSIILNHLWKGKLKKAINVLKQVHSKNDKKREELVKYLIKRKQEIINYEKRKEAGKIIGSGRIEKGCDLIVGIRQKDKARSWSEKGSTALALVKMNIENIKMQ